MFDSNLQSALDAQDRACFFDARFDQESENVDRNEAFENVLNKKEWLEECIENSESVKACVIGLYKALLNGNQKSAETFSKDLVSTFTSALDGYVDVEVAKLEKF